MDLIQEKALELLIEFDSICKEQNLVYCLGPRTAAQALLHKGFTGQFTDIEVCMPVKDCLAFINYIEKTKNETRSVEYMGNSKNYAAYCVDYVNEETTYINLKRGTDYSHYGIGITIQMIRDDTGNKWLAFLETGWENNGYRLTNKAQLSHIAAFGTVRLMMLAGKKHLAKKLFYKFSSQYGSCQSSKKFIRIFKRKRKYFEPDFFEDMSRIEFEKTWFPVPKQTEEYLVTFFGPGWRETIENASSSSASIIKMAEVPYRTYLAHLEQCGQPLKKIFSKQRKSFLSGIFAFRHFRSKDKAWDIACRSGDRLNFYEEFQARREQINNLHMNKAYDELDQIFAEHEKKTKYYLNNNLGLCVSKEILDLQCELLENRGETEVVRQLKSLVPKEHMAPLKSVE